MKGKILVIHVYSTSSTSVSRYGEEEVSEARQGRDTGRSFYSLRRQARMETEEEGQVLALQCSQ